jgi:hypothetical protein
MSSLYRRAANLSPKAAAKDHLGGVSSLSHQAHFQMELDSIDFHLPKAFDGVSWTPTLTMPTTAALRGVVTTAVKQIAADETQLDAQQTAVRAAVSQLHEELLSRFSAVDPVLGKAYGLGRALADTCRPGQQPADLQHSFQDHRLGQLFAWLGDLASVLPVHSAKAVRQSLTWWRDYAYAAKLVTDQHGLLTGVKTTAPGLVPDSSISTRVIASVTSRPVSVPIAGTAPTAEKFLPALGRQGELWRTVLTGERDATHVLQADDFVQAAQNTVMSAWQIVRSLPKKLWLVAGAILVVVVACSAAIVWASSATPGAKIGGVLGFFVAGLVSLGRLAGSAGRQLRPMVAKVEAPLWDAEMDQVIAVALTRPPVGRPDPTGWAGFVDTELPQVAAAAAGAG